MTLGLTLQKQSCLDPSSAGMSRIDSERMRRVYRYEEAAPVLLPLQALVYPTGVGRLKEITVGYARDLRRTRGLNSSTAYSATELAEAARVRAVPPKTPGRLRVVQKRLSWPAFYIVSHCFELFLGVF